jgi:nitroimidazol reductase NimA-like FMN-containing flavoprotein (pyridoxamine 5'-phosphate oxidase superfamily)
VSSPPVRRAEKLMPRAKVDELLSTGYCGHLATISPDGSPYVCPLLYVRARRSGLEAVEIRYFGRSMIEALY